MPETYNLLADEGVAVAPKAAAVSSLESGTRGSSSFQNYSLVDDPAVKIAAPTGEDIYQKVFAKGSTYEPSADEVWSLLDYEKNKPSPGLGGRIKQFAQAGWETLKHFGRSTARGASEMAKTAEEKPLQVPGRLLMTAAETPIRALAQVPGLPLALGALNLQRKFLESSAANLPPEQREQFLKQALHTNFMRKLKLQRAMDEISEGKDSVLGKVAKGTSGGEDLPEALKPWSGAAEVGQLAVPLPVPRIGRLPATRQALIRGAIEAAERGPGVASKVLKAGEKVAGGVETAAGMPQELLTRGVEHLTGKSREGAELASELVGISGAVGGAASGTPIGAVAAGMKGTQYGARMAKNLLEFGRRLAAKGESQVPRLLQLANDASAPSWIRGLAYGLHRSGAGAAGELVKDVAKTSAEGAAVGAGLGAISGEGMDAVTSYAGGGAAVGGAMRLLQPAAAHKKYQRQMGDLGDFYLHLKEQGVPEATMLKLPDDVALQAATIRANFHDRLGIKVLDGPAYDAAVSGQGGEGTAGFYNKADNTIYLNVDAQREALTHEVGHALLKAVGADGEARLMIDSALGRDGINKAREQYALAMAISAAAKGMRGESPNAVLLAAKAKVLSDPNLRANLDAVLQQLDQRHGGPEWIYDEIYADHAYGLLLGKDVQAEVFDTGVWRDLKEKAMEVIARGTVGEVPEGAIFSAVNIYTDPKLRQMLREHFRSVRERGPLKKVEKETKEGTPKGTPVPVELLGEHPAAPAEVNPATGRKESDFFVVEQNGAKTLRTPGEVRRIERTRQAETKAAFPEAKPAPKEDTSPEVKPRVTPSGQVETSGTKIGPQIEGMQTVGPHMKETARLADQLIAAGEGGVLDTWYQAAAHGYRWAKDLRKRLANIAASKVKLAPFLWKVSKEGNILVVGLSLTAAERKLAKWSLDQSPMLRPWANDVEAFKADLIQYLKNHAEGKPGHVDDKKKNALNAFVLGDNRAYHDLNPLRDTLRGEDKQGIIRSLRLDRIATVEISPEKGWVGEYGKKVLNYSPEVVAEPNKEWVKSAAVRTAEGEVFTGLFHVDALENLHIARGWDREASPNSWGPGIPAEMGYLTSTGRFVSREEGYKIAEQQNQLQPIANKEERRGRRPGELISEEVTRFEPGDPNAARPEPVELPPDPDAYADYPLADEARLKRQRQRRQMPGQPVDFSPETGKRKERITGAAYKIGEKIVRGRTHHDAWMELSYQEQEAIRDQGGRPGKGIIRGFITNRGRFVLPEEAYQIAMARKQVSPESQELTRNVYKDREQLPLDSATVDFSPEVPKQQEMELHLEPATPERVKPMKFYSQILRTLRRVPDKASPEQVRAALKQGLKEKGKQLEPPVKKGEMKDVRDDYGVPFDEWLDANPKATKKEIQEWVEDNYPDVTETDAAQKKENDGDDEYLEMDWREDRAEPGSDYIEERAKELFEEYKETAEKDADGEELSEGRLQELRELAERVATEHAEEDAAYIYTDETTGIKVVGNDDMGYHVTNAHNTSLMRWRNGRREDAYFDDVSDAKDFARGYAMENGLLDNPDYNPYTEEYQYEEYRTPGNYEDYREVLLESQAFEPYTSSHFDEIEDAGDRYLMHIRKTRRTDKEGNDVYYIEEIQSDRSDSGKEKGWKRKRLTKEAQAKLDDLKTKETKAKTKIRKNGLELAQVLRDLLAGSELVYREYNRAHFPKEARRAKNYENPRIDRTGGYHYSGPRRDKNWTRMRVTDLEAMDRFLEENLGQAPTEGNYLYDFRTLELVADRMMRFLSQHREKPKDLVAQQDRVSDLWLELSSQKDRLATITDDIRDIVSERGTPEMAFEKNWAEVGWKWGLLDAIKENVDRYGWATDAQQQDRYSSYKGTIYDKQLVNYANDMLKRYGAKVELGNLKGYKGPDPAVQQRQELQLSVVDGTNAHQFAGERWKVIADRPLLTDADRAAATIQVYERNQRGDWEKREDFVGLEAVRQYIEKQTLYDKPTQKLPPDALQYHYVELTPELKAKIKQEGVPLYSPEVASDRGRAKVIDRAVSEAAVRDTKTGEIFTGLTHADAYDLATEGRGGWRAPFLPKGFDEGFVTNEGEFLNREQALRRALETKQLSAAYGQSRKGLEAESFDDERIRKKSNDYSPEAVVGVSPNIEEGLSNAKVVKRLRNDEAARFRSVLRDRAKALGWKAVPRYAYGVWKDGGENSFSVYLPEVESLDDLKRYAAEAGLAGFQKGVIAFIQKDGGKGRLYRFEVPKESGTRVTRPSKDDEWTKINEVLQANGIQYSTIIPLPRGGHVIEIIDMDGGLDESVGNVLQHYGIKKGRGEVIYGEAEFIGGNTRAEGRREYRRVLGAKGERASAPQQ